MLFSNPCVRVLATCQHKAESLEIITLFGVFKTLSKAVGLHSLLFWFSGSFQNSSEKLISPNIGRFFYHPGMNKL